jgi:uncharacterized protein YjiS (DUF1127 family)
MIHNLTTPVLDRRPAPPRRTPLAALTHAIAACWKAMALHRAMRRDEYFLLGQPDYILRDIGIGRGEIESAVRGRTRR